MFPSLFSCGIQQKTANSPRLKKMSKSEFKTVLAMFLDKELLTENSVTKDRL
jgi:hypothetical protein